MMWHHRYLKDDIDKIIEIGEVVDGNIGILYDARAEYMKNTSWWTNGTP
jgi:hypothetical protein